MPARTQVPEKMMIAQLNSVSQIGSPTLGARGKNEKTKPTRRKAREISLITPPHFPSEKRLGSNGWPCRRFSRTLPMEIIYENIRAALDTERIAWRAAFEPKLMADRIRATARQTINCKVSSVLGIRVMKRCTETYSVRRDLPCWADVADP